MTKEKIDVMKVAALARLRVSPDEAAVLAPQLARILEHIETLNSLETSAIERTTSTTVATAPLGDDHPHRDSGTKPSEALSQAPAQVDGQFAVPRFVEN